MNPIPRSILAVVVTGVWVSASEFFRNEILLKTSWVTHFRGLGIVFPSEPVNAVMWVATWNLSVLPLGILVYAVPLSLLEAFVGALIGRSISPGKES